MKAYSEEITIKQNVAEKHLANPCQRRVICRHHGRSMDFRRDLKKDQIVALHILGMWRYLRVKTRKQSILAK